MPESDLENQPEQIRATNAADAFWTLDPFAVVRPTDPWYSNLDSFFTREHYGFSNRLRRHLTPTSGGPNYIHLGIIGHGGTGKTTQVRQVVSTLGEEMFPIFVDAIATLDLAEFNFADLLLVLSQNVLAALSEAQVEIPAEEAELVRKWFDEEMLSEAHRNEIFGSIETEARLAGGVPLLAKLAAKITGQLRSNNEYRTEIRRRVERDPADLLRRVNMLLDVATSALGAHRLLVVYDNLEKIINRALVDAAVIRRAEELRQLRCHLLLFFSPTDQYAPITAQASQAFTCILLPVLPIREREQQVDFVSEAAERAVRDLLDKRLELEKVFIDPADCVRVIARLSGGRVRDVFHLARLACEYADPNRITTAHIEFAARNLCGERTVTLKAEQWARLAQIRREKRVVNDPENDGKMLLHSHVLNYNGAPWWDVHPLTALDDRFSEAWHRLSPLTKP